MKNMQVCKQISDCLTEGSFPSIVLLQGPWGSGKTHLTNTYLIPELSNSHPYNATANYISLYGITSLDDFRDKLLSQALSNNSNTSGWLSLAKNTIGNATKLFGDRGATLGLMNALTQPIRHQLLSKLNNMIIIVDDLERVSSEQLISEILGECLNLADKHDHVWVVVVANEKKLKDHSILEKTFLDRVSITLSPKNIIDFIDEKSPSLLCDSTRQHMYLLAEELKLTNYRLIQRITQRYSALKQAIEKSESIDQTTALNKLIDHITRICHAHYEHGYSIEDILEQISLKKPSVDYTQNLNNQSEESKSKAVPKSIDIDEEKRQRLLRTIFISGYGKITHMLTDYCINMSPLPSDVIDALELPLSSSLLDKIISRNIYQLTDDELLNAGSEAEKYILEGGNKPFYTWLKAIDTYIHLIDYEYISGNVDDIIEKATLTSERKGFFNSENISSFDHHIFRSFENEKIKKLCDKLQDNVKELGRNSRISTLQGTLLKSWSEASKEIYLHFEFKPFLFGVNEELLIDSIVNKWTPYDVIIFGQFLGARYTISNIHDYLSSEFSTVKSITEKLSDKLNNMPASMKKGKVTELVEYLQESILLIDKAENRALSINKITVSDET